MSTNTNRISAIAFCTVAAILVYLNSLTNGFALDDVPIVQLNERVHHLGAWREIWLTPYWTFDGLELGLYRPMTIFLFALQWAAGNGAAWLFHAVNVTLHAAATVLVFLLLERLSDRTGALLGALVFAVHPVHTEAVANVVGQAEIVGTLAVVGACLVHASRGSTGETGWARRAVLVLLFAVALMTKENTVVLPGLLVLVDFAQRRVRPVPRDLIQYARAMFVPLTLLGATLAAYLLLRFDVMGGAVLGSNAAPGMPFLREEYRVLNALRALPELLRLLILPFDLSADYTPAVLMPVESIRPMVVLGGLLLAALAVLAALTPWRPAVGFPAAWFLIAILPVSNLLFPIGVLVAERTLYLPSVAVSAAVAFAWYALRERGVRRQWRTAIGVAGAVTLVFFGIRILLRNPDWKDTPAVQRAFVRDHPESYRAQWSLAAYYLLEGDSAKAEVHFALGTAIYDRDPHFLAAYGEFLIARGRTTESIALLEQAHRERPQAGHAAALLAHGYLTEERYEDAIATIEAAERAGVGRSTVTFVTAAAHEGLGRPAAAVAYWRAGIANVPQPSWRMWAFLARALAGTGDIGRARAALLEGRSLTSDTTALRIVGEVDVAVSAGCYAPDADGHAPPNWNTRPCDPLGRWVGLMPARREGPTVIGNLRQ